jgi:hypothetical protein
MVGQPPSRLRQKCFKEKHLRGRVQRDRRVVTRKSRLLAERYVTELVEPCGALPRKCFFIYLPGVWSWFGKGKKGGARPEASVAAFAARVKKATGEREVIVNTAPFLPVADLQ